MSRHKHLIRLINSIHKKGLFLVLACLTVGLAVLLVSIDSYVNYTSPAQLRSNWYSSLDLTQAATAKYSNTPLRRLKDLGVDNSVRHYIVGFGVPKDNLSEYGLMTLPTSQEPKGGYPVVILCHGYSNPQSYSTLNAYLADMEFYSQHGFVVIKPDFRGQGLSLPNGVATGAFYSMDYNTDLMSLIAAVNKTTYINAGRLNLWGHSMGAYVALRASVLNPNVKNVVLLSGPVGSLADMYNDYVATSDEYNTAAAENKATQIDQHGTPLSNPAFWDKASPLNYTKYSKARFQIHVGSNDKIVPPKFSAELDTALAKTGKKHEYYVYAGGDHGLLAQRHLIWQRSLAFFENK